MNEQRTRSLARIKNRHLENELVAFKANQACKESEIERLLELQEADPALFNELVQKRTLKFKDPISRSQSYTFPLNELPKKAID